ncbi:hypothetical protein AAFF_G00249780 [Aldrovandia affinis]|uniref:Uncharacterized protein n=1 Tax=Aldrovandia affinis TaxID=143900 RepID=A0AAD7QZN8_9TELE|nr:hypothetical protein AAFF_G00249780 [Aldrovandia affinis]
MEAVFTEMQTAVEQQGAKQQAMLSSYKCSVAELQKVNDRSVSGMMSTVTAFQSIKDLVHSSMAKCHAGMMEQETLWGDEAHSADPSGEDGLSPALGSPQHCVVAQD